MKARNFIRLISFVSIISFCQVIGAAEITGEELWEKVITYHDPGSNWDSFDGRVRLVTTNSRGRLYSETISIDADRDFYQTEKDNATGLVAGVNDGTAFSKFTDTPKNKQQGDRQLRQSRSNAPMMRQHHSGHLGMPMQMKLAGLKAQKEVKLAQFQGKACYALELTGGPPEGPFSYWRGHWTLYADPDTFAILGGRHQKPDPESNLPDLYFVCHGVFEVDGIKIQSTKSFFRSEDDSYVFTDVYGSAR